MKVPLRIICIHPPALEDQQMFGVQDKAQNLLPGTIQADGTLAFDFEVEAKQVNGKVNFSGSYVHGTPDKRFIYLSYGYQEKEQWVWIRRIKIPLNGLTWEQLEAAATQQHRLTATVDGRQAATVSPLTGWIPTP